MLTITLSEYLPILEMLDDGPSYGIDPDLPEDLSDLAHVVSMYHPDESVRLSLDAFCAFNVSDVLATLRGPERFSPDLDVGEPSDAGIENFETLP